jgi:putative flippase GtrA
MTLTLAEPTGGRSPGGGGSGGAPTRAFIRQAVRFALIGSAGTGAGLALYSLFGLWMNPVIANAAAWLITTFAINGLQRHYAFGITDPTRAAVDQTVTLIFSFASLLVSSAVVAPLTDAEPGQTLTALIAVNSVVGAARFFAVRCWFSGTRCWVRRTSR